MMLCVANFCMTDQKQNVFILNLSIYTINSKFFSIILRYFVDLNNIKKIIVINVFYVRKTNAIIRPPFVFLIYAVVAQNLPNFFVFINDIVLYFIFYDDWVVD